MKAQAAGCIKPAATVPPGENACQLCEEDRKLKSALAHGQIRGMSLVASPSQPSITLTGFDHFFPD
jgi:hypothetical protein